MEQFNSKLYKKYVDLKKRKLDEEWRNRGEAELRDFNFAVEVIDELKNENERLRIEMDSLQSRCIESEELVLEERRKAMHLSNEVERLQKLLAEKNDDSGIRSPHTRSNTIRSPHMRSESVSPLRMVALDPCARQTEVQDKEASAVPYTSSQLELAVVSDGNQTNGDLFDHASSCVPHSECCRISMSTSGKTTSKNDISCVFQTLMELLVRMKFSVGSQPEGICISAVHQMSGYTFTLTLLRHGDGEDGELRYRASSLGTLERVALGWMKEEIVFSMSMWPVFFMRMVKVIGHN